MWWTKSVRNWILFFYFDVKEDICFQNVIYIKKLLKKKSSVLYNYTEYKYSYLYAE